MTATDQYIPVPESSQDTDAAIVAMLNKMLADDSIFVEPNDDGEYELLEYTADGKLIIDVYETRASAYRAGIDCLIEACVFAWDQGDES